MLWGKQLMCHSLLLNMAYAWYSFQKLMRCYCVSELM